MSKFIVKKSDTFNVEQTLDCGQVFRFKKTEYGFVVYSLNHFAKITENNDEYVFECDDIDYFYNYFDLDRDYKEIQESYKGDAFVESAIKYASGIHILNQDPIEMIISFLISQNNNIPRIKNIIEKMCESLGTNMGDYYAFPTLEKLASVGEDFYKNIGAGYRSAYLDKVSNYLLNCDIEDFIKLSTSELREKLLSMYGIGRKVADCVLLFGFRRLDVFPVDTWIYKTFENEYKNVQPDKMAILLAERYGKTSGLVQQWAFYSKRNKNI